MSVLRSGFIEQLCDASPDDPPLVFNVKGSPATTPAGLRALQAIPVVTDRPFTLNVRVRAARRIDDSDRDVMGWHARLNDKQRSLSIGRWWSEPSRDVVGAAFIATIAGYVVAHGRILDLFTERGLAAYVIDWDDADVAKAWHRRRVDLSTRGGTIVYHEATD